METWQQASGIQRPEACCSSCPRRIPDTWKRGLLRKLGILPSTVLNDQCGGPEDYITATSYVTRPNEHATSSEVHITSEMDCPLVYGVNATDWNIAWLNKTATERQKEGD